VRVSSTVDVQPVAVAEPVPPGDVRRQSADRSTLNPIAVLVYTRLCFQSGLRPSAALQ
jgi:hypothetical protein